MHEIPELDKAGLRRFGLSTGAIFIVLFGLALPWLFGAALPRWPWALGGLLIAWATVAPATLRLFYRGWMRLGLLLGSVMNRLILGIVFFAVVLPIGFVMRLLGHDPMARHFNPNVASYRTPSRQRERQSIERPF
jgi:hypothetical protein